MFTGVHVRSLGDAGLHHLVGDSFIRALELRLPAQHTHPELATVRGVRLPHPEAAGRGETRQRQTQHAYYPKHDQLIPCLFRKESKFYQVCFQIPAFFSPFLTGYWFNRFGIS